MVSNDSPLISTNFKTTFMKTIFLLPLFIFSSILTAQKKEITIDITPITDNIYLLTGQGGNIGVFKNEKGLFIIDDQFARLSDKILSRLSTISDQTVTMVINTHYHRDHTGGNANMTKQGATIFAHANVRKRMKNNQKKTNSPTTSSLPVITFDEGLQLYFDNEDIQVFHVHNAHTDGDALVYFNQGNVLHMGDTFFNGRYPYIDLTAGGNIKGYIEAVQKGIFISNEDTHIIPGHGKIASQNDLKSYLNMLETITSSIENEIKNGVPKKDIISNSILTEKYDILGYGNGFISSEKFRETIYSSLTQKQL